MVSARFGWCGHRAQGGFCICQMGVAVFSASPRRDLEEERWCLFCWDMVGRFSSGPLSFLFLIGIPIRESATPVAHDKDYSSVQITVWVLLQVFWWMQGLF